MDNKKQTGIRKLKAIASFFASLITLASSVATCITVFEMRDERNQSYKPYFVIESTRYTEQFEKPVFSLNNTNNLINSLLLDRKDLTPMAIIIDNIGSGTSTNIEIAFSCEEYQDYWETVCSYYDNHSIEITDNELSVDYYSSVYQETKTYEHRMFLSDLIVNRPYVFTKESLEVPLPQEYCRLLHAVAYCTNGDYGELPTIDLEICYDDLQGINYKRKYSLGIKVYVDLNSDEEFNYAEYVIEQIE